MLGEETVLWSQSKRGKKSMTEKVGFRPGVKSGCLGKLWMTRVLNRRQSDSHRERKCAENYNKWILNLFFKTTITILIISNHNSFGVLLDKIASVYFIWKIYIYILALEIANPGN